MARSTYFNLEIKDGPKELIEIVRQQFPQARKAFDNQGNYLEEVRWGSFEKDMREFSLKNPEVLFNFSGETDEYLSNFEHYFRNGKDQYCAMQISYEPCRL